MTQLRCPGCMNLKVQRPFCEHCGFDENAQNLPHQLPIGTVLQDQYAIGRVLGQGGFGITYLGWDQVLNRPVAIKEYFPASIVTREAALGNSIHVTTGGSFFYSGRDRFLQEAQTLAKLQNVPEIARVHNFFSANGTAYIVMEYVDGITLQSYVQQKGGRLSPAEALGLLQPITRALSNVHRAGLIHRDISPDNIMLDQGGRVRLLDFGTARPASSEAGGMATHSTQAILKHGFAPIEQYQTRGILGPWTDEYALCATVYFCMTGQIPPEATSRILGEATVDWYSIPGLSPHQAAVLDQGMALKGEARFPSLEAFWNALTSPVPYTAPIPERSPYTAPLVPPPMPQPAHTPPSEEQGKPRQSQSWTFLAAIAALIVVALLLFLPKEGKQPPLPSSPPSTLPPLTTATTPPTAQEQRIQEIRSHCDALEDTLEAVRYLQECVRQSPGDAQIQALLEEYILLHETTVLDQAASLAAEYRYRLAIAHLLDARKEFDSQKFYDAAVQYRQEFGIFNSTLLSAGKYNTMLVNGDGTVTVLGDNVYKELTANSWTDIVAVAAGDRHMIGLRSDGTLVSSGNGDLGQNDVGSWWDIIAISAGDTHTVGLQSDGTVLATGYNHENQCDAYALMRSAGSKRIVSIAAGYGHTLALLEDGTVVAVGGNDNGECDVTAWRDIVAIYAGTEISVGLKADGTVVATGQDVENWALYAWKEIDNLACGDYYLVGVRSDGHVMSAGAASAKYGGQLNVGGLTDVLLLAAGNDHTVAVQKDGTIVSVGSNSHGQRDCDGMTVPIP